MKKDLIENYIDGVEILGLSIVIDGNHLNSEIDLGSVTITAEDREYCMDVTQSYRSFENGETTIKLDVTTLDDDNIFPDCPFNIKATDLMLDKASVTLFYECEEPWKHCTLFVKDNGCTKAINVELDGYEDLDDEEFLFEIKGFISVKGKTKEEAYKNLIMGEGIDWNDIQNVETII